MALCATLRDPTFWLGVFAAVTLTACGSASASDSASPTYTVYFENKSMNPVFAYMYQTNPGPQASNAQSLVWFGQGNNPGTTVRFSWALDYAMFWSTPLAAPGVVPEASQLLPCTLESNNQVTFSHNGFGFLFDDQVNGSAEGIKIVQDASIAANTASVGTAMGGAAVFAVPAQPNVATVFLPSPTYWMAFTFEPIQQGEIIPMTPSVPPLSIVFPPNEGTCTATLSATNEWEPVKCGP